MKSFLKKRLLWLAWLGLLIFSAYFIPFKYIGKINKITACFSFWIVFCVAAIISIIKITSYWRD